MTREDLLKEIIEIIEPDNEVNENTVLCQSDDFDSLSLFNIMVLLKHRGINADVIKFASCQTVGDILDLLEK